MPHYATPYLLLLGDGTIISLPTSDGTEGSPLLTNADGSFSFSSIITDNGSSIGIGTTSPSVPLEVVGSIVSRETDDENDAVKLVAGVNSGSVVVYSEGVPTAAIVGSTGNISALTLSATGSGDSYFTGNVGIGTALPAAPLNIIGPDGKGITPTLFADTTLLMENSGAIGDNICFAMVSGTSGNVQFMLGDTGNVDACMLDYDNAINELKITVASAERVRIDNAGYVGINETDPAARLHVVGLDGAGTTPSINTDTVALFENSTLSSDDAAVSIVAGAAGVSILNFGDTADEDIGSIRFDHSVNSMGLYLGVSSVLTLDDGFVGVGVTDPAVQLEAKDVMRVRRDGVSSQYIELADDAAGHYLETTGGTGKPLHINSGSSGTSPIYLQTGGTTRATIDSTGNVDATSFTGSEATLSQSTNNLGPVTFLDLQSSDDFGNTADGPQINFGGLSTSSMATIGLDANNIDAANVSFKINTGSGLVQVMAMEQTTGWLAIGPSFTPDNFYDPQAPLHVEGPDGISGTVAFDPDTVAVFQNDAATTDNAYIGILSGNAADAGILFGDAGNDAVATLFYDHDADDDRLKITTALGTKVLNTMTPIVIRPQQLIADSTSGFGITVRNQHVLAAFDDSLDEIAYYTGILPDDYQGDGLTVEIKWCAETATSGVCVWDVAFERIGIAQQDIDSDGFAANNTGTGSAPGTSGHVTTKDIVFTDGADMDSVAAGEAFRLRITRPAFSNGGDTMAGDAQILAIKIRGSNDV